MHPLLKLSSSARPSCCSFASTSTEGCCFSTAGAFNILYYLSFYMWLFTCFVLPNEKMSRSATSARRNSTGNEATGQMFPCWQKPRVCNLTSRLHIQDPTSLVLFRESFITWGTATMWWIMERNKEGVKKGWTERPWVNNTKCMSMLWKCCEGFTFGPGVCLCGGIAT